MTFEQDPNLPPEKYWIVAFELADLAPRRDMTRANLYVSIRKRRIDTVQGSLQLAKRPRTRLGSHIVRDFDLGSLTGPYNTAQKAIKVRDQIALHLAWRGHVVNPAETPSHRLYVIDLDAEILGKTGKKCVYVGSTSKPLEVRLEEHRNGDKSRPKRARAVIGINEKLTPTHTIFYSRWDALVEEYRLGEQLKAQGFHVEGPVYRESGLINPFEMKNQRTKRPTGR